MSQAKMVKVNGYSFTVIIVETGIKDWLKKHKTKEIKVKDYVEDYLFNPIPKRGLIGTCLNPEQLQNDNPLKKEFDLEKTSFLIDGSLTFEKFTEIVGKDNVAFFTSEQPALSKRVGP